MSEDLAGRQKAEQAAREATPGRYDGATVADIAHRIEMEAMGIAAWRASNGVAPTVEYDARLRAVAERSPQAAAALGLLNAGAPVIVAIDEGGRPLTEPTRDVDLLAGWWESGGSYMTRWPAIPCGESGGLFGLLIDPGAGQEWFKKVATVHHPSRVERLMAAITDRVDALGVPDRADDWDEEPQQKPDELRAPMDARLWLVEDMPKHQAVARVWTGPIRGREGQAAMAAARPLEARQLTARVWSWPTGQTLPVGRELRPGVSSLSAIPAMGAEVLVGGVRLVVRQYPVLSSPPPEWLISAIRELA